MGDHRVTLSPEDIERIAAREEGVLGVLLEPHAHKLENNDVVFVDAAGNELHRFGGLGMNAAQERYHQERAEELAREEADRRGPAAAVAAHRPSRKG